MRSPRAAVSAVFVVLVVLSLVLLAGGSANRSPQTLPQGAGMDGMYAVSLGPVQGLDGKPVPNSESVQTWAIRSACRVSGCVATISSLRDGDPTKPPWYTTAFDFVDGHWVGAREATGVCKDDPSGSLWVTYSLEPQADGVVAGTRQEIYVNDPCFGSRTVSMKRTGDLNPAVPVADPASATALATSPAAAFHGRYRDKSVDKATGETVNDTFYDVTTYCVRTGERCISSFVSENRKSSLAYVFADSKWVMDMKPFAITCADNSDAQRKRNGELTLPEPAQNPFQTLTGTVHSVDTGGCPLTMDLDVTVERVGDAR